MEESLLLSFGNNYLLDTGRTVCVDVFLNDESTDLWLEYATAQEIVVCRFLNYFIFIGCDRRYRTGCGGCIDDREFLDHFVNARIVDFQLIVLIDSSRKMADDIYVNVVFSFSSSVSLDVTFRIPSEVGVGI